MLFQAVIDGLLWENEHTAKPQVVGDGWGRKEGGDGGPALRRGRQDLAAAPWPLFIYCLSGV